MQTRSCNALLMPSGDPMSRAFFFTSRVFFCRFLACLRLLFCASVLSRNRPPRSGPATLLVPSQPSIEAPDTPDKSDKPDKTEKETSQAKGKEEQKKYRGAENRPDSAQCRGRGRPASKPQSNEATADQQADGRSAAPAAAAAAETGGQDAAASGETAKPEPPRRRPSPRKWTCSSV